MYDSAALYVAIRCEDSGPIVARLTRRDRVIESDRVGVEIDAFGDHRAAYGFWVNAAGVKWTTDARVTMRPITTGTPSGPRAVTRDEQGWSAEFRIPFSALRFTAAPEVAFRLQIAR